VTLFQKNRAKSKKSTKKKREKENAARLWEKTKGHARDADLKRREKKRGKRKGIQRRGPSNGIGAVYKTGPKNKDKHVIQSEKKKGGGFKKRQAPKGRSKTKILRAKAKRLQQHKLRLCWGSRGGKQRRGPQGDKGKEVRQATEVRYGSRDGETILPKTPTNTGYKNKEQCDQEKAASEDISNGKEGQLWGKSSPDQKRKKGWLLKSATELVWRRRRKKGRQRTRTPKTEDKNELVHKNGKERVQWGLVQKRGRVEKRPTARGTYLCYQTSPIV